MHQGVSPASSTSHANAYLWRPPPRVHQHRATSLQVTELVERVLPVQATPWTKSPSFPTPTTSRVGTCVKEGVDRQENDRIINDFASTRNSLCVYGVHRFSPWKACQRLTVGK